HHVPDFDLARDPALLWRDVRVERDLEARTVARHLLEDPLPGRADPLVGLVDRRQRVARAEAFELLENGDQPLFGNRLNERDDSRIEVRRLRQYRPAEAGYSDRDDDDGAGVAPRGNQG